jgi:hypothetical protein
MLKKLTNKKAKSKRNLYERSALHSLCYSECKIECVITGLVVTMDYTLEEWM